MTRTHSRTLARRSAPARPALAALFLCVATLGPGAAFAASADACAQSHAALRVDGVTWEPTYAAATERSKAEGRVLMVAVQLVDEIASERMMDDVYPDAIVAALSTRTVNLGTSNAYQVGDEDFLEYFGAPSVEEARTTDVKVRGEILRPDEDGFVVAPQHVFLAPDGEVLLSVAYEISAAELEWCLVEAILAVDPEAGVEHTSRARAPRRLAKGTVGGSTSTPPPPSPPDAKELAELLRQVDDLEGPELMAALERIMTSPDRKALKEIEKRVRLASNRGGGGPNRRTLLRRIGELSPPAYWEIVGDELDRKEVAVRNEAAVALEQLGAADAESVLVKSIAREDEPSVRKNLARALGASGYDSARARRELVKVAKKDDDALVRVNAVLGIGQLTPHDEARAFLGEVLAEGDERERAAALVAMAWSRDSFWNTVLRRLDAQEEIDKDTAGPLDAKLLDALSEVIAARTGRVTSAWNAALAVLDGGPLVDLAPLVRELGSDELARKRLFGEAGE